ncbi:MAG: integrase [Gammaproteobacteria bacterium]|nr:integrase [Gammaproteobacteria bacterium]
MPTKKNGKWHVDLRPDGRNGQRIRRSFETRAEANRFEAYVTGQAAQGLPWNPTPADTRRFSELIELWHQNHGIFLKEGVRRKSVLLAIADQMRDPIAAGMTSDDFIRYRKNKKVKGEPANPKTLNNHLGYCNAVFNELLRTDYISYNNPFGKIRPITISERELSYLTPAQITEILAAAKASRNPDLYLVCVLCLSTGCRWGEAEALTTDRVKNCSVTFTDTKGKRNRTIPITAELQKQLLEHGRAGQHWIFRDCMVAFDRMAARLTFKLPRGQSTHILRHTFASYFIQNGGDILTLQKILGHASITMTMRYAHLAPGHLESARTINPLCGQFVDTGKGIETLTH